MPWARRLPSQMCQSQSYRSNCLSAAQRRKMLPTSTRNTEVASLHPGSHWRPWWGQYLQRSATPCILSIASASASLYSLKPLDLHCPATLLLCMCVASSHQPVVNFQATYDALCCIRLVFVPAGPHFWQAPDTSYTGIGDHQDHQSRQQQPL